MAELPPRNLQALDGAALRQMLAAATAALEAQEAAINALNVFPVPDGDTGTNMLLTMREALAEADRQGSGAVQETARALAHGALMGARGNSGVILSEVLRSLSRVAEGKERITGRDLALAFQEAAGRAYQAVSKPVEGTILTVIRDVADATRDLIESRQASAAAVMDIASRAAEASVARTPLLLPVLRENGVVDAGGEGLSVLLEGALCYLRGSAPAGPRAGGPTASAPAHDASVATAAGTYGFCTEVLLEGPAVTDSDLRQRLMTMGDSVLVAGEGPVVKAHLHTRDPDGAVAYLRSVGKVVRVKVDDIDAQHRQFAQQRASRPPGVVGVAAVVSGDGLRELFRSLGAAAIIPGGQTMNPSVEQLVAAARELPTDDVILLPNNRNVIPAALRARELVTQRRVWVVPTEDLPQGVAALMAYNFEADAAPNIAAMERARRSLKTGEITRAVRRARLDGKEVAAGQFIGLTGGELSVAADSLNEAAERLLERLGCDARSTVTLYYGAGVQAADARRSAERLRRRWPSADVQTFAGGQPHYHFYVAIE